jgi:hypothetical protein
MGLNGQCIAGDNPRCVRGWRPETPPTGRFLGLSEFGRCGGHSGPYCWCVVGVAARGGPSCSRKLRADIWELPSSVQRPGHPTRRHRNLRRGVVTWHVVCVRNAHCVPDALSALATGLVLAPCWLPAHHQMPFVALWAGSAIRFAALPPQSVLDNGLKTVHAPRFKYHDFRLSSKIAIFHVRALSERNLAG